MKDYFNDPDSPDLDDLVLEYLNKHCEERINIAYYTHMLDSKALMYFIGQAIKDYNNS